MIKIAVTGNIGSGKSEFINFISKLGFYYISSDVIISNLYKDIITRGIILQKLDLNEKNYKQEILNKIHNEVFNRQLKKVIYPLLFSKKKRLSQKHKTHRPIFYEVPLLYEENLSRDYNVTVFIKADINKRRQRVLNRGVSNNYFTLMNSKQINENIKKNKSTFTLDNNGSILNLRLNIIKLLNKL